MQVGLFQEGLQLPAGSRGLDAGCGIGLQALLLGQAVAPGGHVTALDSKPEFLVRARGIAANSGLSEQISFQKGDVNKLPFDDDTFDWAWCADTIWAGPKETGCPAEDPLPLVKELARVVRPGGSVAFLYWSSQKLLPGYPLLEGRFNALPLGSLPSPRG